MSTYTKGKGSGPCCMLCANWAGPRVVTGTKKIEADANAKGRCYAGAGCSTEVGPAYGHSCSKFEWWGPAK